MKSKVTVFDVVAFAAVGYFFGLTALVVSVVVVVAIHSFVC